MSRNPKALTIHHAQEHQPWTVPYSRGVERAKRNGVPHILASHDVLHAMKSVGKLAALFERLDHTKDGKLPPDEAFEAKQTVRAMAADLVTAALRLGNLYQFSVAEALVERVKEKNAEDIIDWPTVVDAPRLTAAALDAMRRGAAQGDVEKAEREVLSAGHKLGIAEGFAEPCVDSKVVDDRACGEQQPAPSEGWAVEMPVLAPLPIDTSSLGLCDCIDPEQIAHRRAVGDKPMLCGCGKHDKGLPDSRPAPPMLGEAVTADGTKHVVEDYRPPRRDGSNRPHGPDFLGSHSAAGTIRHM